VLHQAAKKRILIRFLFFARNAENILQKQLTQPGCNDKMKFHLDKSAVSFFEKMKKLKKMLDKPK